MYQAMIVPRSAAADEAAFGRRPVGSGPFRFVSWEADRLIRLDRFGGYFGGDALLDGVRFQIYSTDQHRRVLEDFSRGELDEMPVFSEAVKTALAGRDDLKWFHRPSLSLFFYGINCSTPPLNEPGLRRMLSGAIDRRLLVETVFNNRFEIARGILPPGMPGYQPPGEPAAGGDEGPSGGGQTIEVVSAYDTPRVRAEMDLIRKDWKRLGVHLEEKYITDWEAFNDYIRSEQVQVYRYVWFADMPDPDGMLYPLFASDSADNFMRFRDERVDRLLNAARATIDPVRRTEVYRNVEQLILESSPLIPLFYLSDDRVYQGTVMNLQPNALGAHAVSLHNVWLDRSQ
jgi:ABC-type transport system substrate-binding protein